MKWSPTQCKPGDIIRVKFGAIYHYGIFVSEQEVIQFGLPPVHSLDRSEEDLPVLATHIDDFCCGQIVEVETSGKLMDKKRFSPRKTMKNAKKRLGETGYDLIHNNCEHFVYECAFGVKYCQQAEDTRQRFRNRPILDVYFCRAEEKEYAPGSSTVVEHLVKKGLARSFRITGEELGFKLSPNGQWRCDGYCCAHAHTTGVAVAAVSNGAVWVTVTPSEENGTAEQPVVTAQFDRPIPCVVSVAGEHRDKVRYFWVDGDSVQRIFTDEA